MTLAYRASRVVDGISEEPVEDGAVVTTVRDVGSVDGLAIDVGRAVDLRILSGPRVVAAGRAIAMTGGMAGFWAGRRMGRKRCAARYARR
jgi:hypothetical protein